MIFFVTGGSRGIGRSIVLDALQAGHDVAFTFVEHREAADEVLRIAAARAPERRCRAYRLDVRRPYEVERIVDYVITDYDTVDVVVNSAAVNRPGLAASLPDEIWQNCIDTNLSGTFYVSRQFLPTFLAAGYGRFIHISSISQTGMTGQVAYSASKAGLIGLSGALAKEYGRKGITSNVLSVGFVDTDMTREQMSESNKAFWHQMCPVGRMGQGSDISAAVLFLASPGASFITGAVLMVTGGLEWAP